MATTARLTNESVSSQRKEAQRQGEFAVRWLFGAGAGASGGT